MLKRKRSLLKLKQKFYNLEYKKKINKFIQINLNNSKFNDYLSKYFFNYRNKKKMISKINIKSVCLLTNRTRSVNNFYNISRICLRDMLSFGIIPGYKKAIW